MELAAKGGRKRDQPAPAGLQPNGDEMPANRIFLSPVFLVGSRYYLGGSGV
jgi:hypothetical protein